MMRLRLNLVAVLGAAVLAPAAPAQVDLPVPVPSVPTPTVPTPSVPLPSLPSAPAPSAPTPVSQPVLPGAGAPSSEPAPSSAPSSGTSGTAPGASAGTSSGASSSPGSAGTTSRRPARRPSIVLAFRAESAQRLALPVIQVAPTCRRAGVLRLRVDAGANRVRFHGRIGRRRLADGTYVIHAPNRTIRFAVVGGKPTREPRRFASNVCTVGHQGELGGAATPAAAEPARTAAAPIAKATQAGAEAGLPHAQPHRGRVLGTAFREAAEAALGLHPLFYVLLAGAILVLAAATLPAALVPSAAVGAALARRRAELTLAGTVAVVAVIVAYLIALA